MKRVRKSQAVSAPPTITLEGVLFLPDQLQKAAQGRATGQSETDYGLPKGWRPKDEYSRAFRIAGTQWKDFSTMLERQDVDAFDITSDFVVELLRDAFGYTNLEFISGIFADGRHYPVNLTAGHVPIVIAPHTLGLDEADVRFMVEGAGSRKKTAFQLAQEALNASPEHLWAIVCNGRHLRLLRDSATLSRPCFLEIDLTDLLASGERFSEFATVWRLLHASRAGTVTKDSAPEDAIWEQWRKAGQEEGARVRDGLSSGVTQALQILGEGFLRHPANEALRAALDTGELSSEAYYQQLLRLVYRLIFLFCVEERGLLHPSDDTPAAQNARHAYAEGYSLARLRNLCLKRHTRDGFDDRWQAAKIVFRSLAAGEPRLALPALGELFAPEQCIWLDAASLGNAHFMAAMENLRWAHNGGTRLPVDYRNMGFEELGSVYESLLELVPDIDLTARSFDFIGLKQGAAGNARKLTGSYYTPDSLVQELIKSALDPVIAARLAENPSDPVSALLAIRVIDPACGSGHFLLAAARRLAEKLAQLRAGTDVPKPVDYRHAMREVVSRCIFGVDKNPLALELARIALWLEGFEEGRPLSFLDHHLQCGDALLGMMDLTALKQGIPKDAYKLLAGDDKAACLAFGKINAAGLKQLERDRQSGQFALNFNAATGLEELKVIEAMPEGDTGEVEAKEAAYQAFLHDAAESRLKQAADLVVGAYLLPKTESTRDCIPTSADIQTILQGMSENPAALKAASTVCEKARVLHWPLVFPQVLAAGGFDCVLGNPPWDVSQLDEKEFFAARAPYIAELVGEERKRAIASLEKGDPILWKNYVSESQRIAAVNNFCRASGRFLLSAFGKLNAYALFAETILEILHPCGRAGFIVPTGIATDDSTKAFFAGIVQGNRLASLLSFENEEFIFPTVHHAFRFSLLTIGSTTQAEFVFFARQPEQIHDSRRRFMLTPEEFRLTNPNTRTCPIFRSKRDAELTKKLYCAAPVLIDENKENGNPWGIKFLQGLFNMTSGSRLFHNAPDKGLLPLYEAKLIHHFDHRWATYMPEGDTRDVSVEEKRNPDFFTRPRYWVKVGEVEERLNEKGWYRGWLMGWRDITGVEKIRTMIASVIPRVGTGNTMPLWITSEPPKKQAALLGNLNALVLDYVARVKVGGIHLTYNYLKQFPVLPPDRYTSTDLAFIVPRVLELTYTAHDLKPWAEDLGYKGPPFIFDPDRRAVLRAELDAYYARLYGLTEEELRYILDPAEVMGEDYPTETFRVLKNKEIAAYGEYRTRRLVLEAWNRNYPFEIEAEELMDGAWCRPPGLDVRAETGVLLAALLKNMNQPWPVRQIRLATVLAMEPRLLTPLLTQEKAVQWQRLVGDEANPLPSTVSSFAARTNVAWGEAVRFMRMNGHLLEDLQAGTWTRGTTVGISTAEWADGRARMAMAFLQTRISDFDGIIQNLPSELRTWVDAA